jgi:hypothetical protein
LTDPSSEAPPPRSSDDDRTMLRLEIPIDTAEDRRALRGALLSARASELSEVRRRAGRLNLGYGTDSGRASMSDEVATLRRRWEMLDRLLAALEQADGEGR